MIGTGRAARQRLVVDLLAAHSVRSQTELAELLAAQGVNVTQATLSRDLVDVGAVKVRTEGGVAVYAVPGETGTPAASEDRVSQLRRACDQLLLSAESSENLVVLRTPPGGANLLASALDTGRPADVVGTIAGDDTVLVIASSVRTAPVVAAYLLGLGDGRDISTEQEETS